MLVVAALNWVLLVFSNKLKALAQVCHSRHNTDFARSFLVSIDTNNVARWDVAPLVDPATIAAPNQSSGAGRRTGDSGGVCAGDDANISDIGEVRKGFNLVDFVSVDIDTDIPIAA